MFMEMLTSVCQGSGSCFGKFVEQFLVIFSLLVCHLFTANFVSFKEKKKHRLCFFMQS